MNRANFDNLEEWQAAVELFGYDSYSPNPGHYVAVEWEDIGRPYKHRRKKGEFIRTYVPYTNKIIIKAYLFT